MTLPGIWYLNHLRTVAAPDGTEALDVGGASLPGSPFVYVGHNRDMAWGFVAALCDDGDLYREQLHPEQPSHYRTPDGWAEFDSRPETIAIRGGRPMETVVRHTRHGPVLSDILPPPAEDSDYPSREVLSYRWAAHTPGNELGLLDGLNRTRDWSGFLSSLEHHVAPSLSCFYGDTQGNIGYALAGSIPLRRRQEPSWLPLDGWNADHDWAGTIPFDELPRLYNPPEGIVATANNRIADPDYPYYLSDLFEPPYRIERIRQGLTGGGRLDMEYMAGLQLDTRSVQAERLLKALRPELRDISREEPALQQSVELLEEWDGDCNARSAAAALFHVFYHRLMWNIWGKELGEELFASYTEILNQPVAPLDHILTDPGSVWFRDTSRKEMMAASLREADSGSHETAGPPPPSLVLGPAPHPHPAARPWNQEVAGALLLTGPLPRRRRRRHPEQLLLPPLPPLRPGRRRVGPDADHPERSHPLQLRHRSGPSRQSGVAALPRPGRAVANRANHSVGGGSEDAMKDWPLLVLAANPRG